MAMDTFCTGTNGGWRKHPYGALLGGQYEICFDISMLSVAGQIQMYFSWRDCHSIARVTSEDGIHWSEPVICLTPRETSEGWDADACYKPFVLKVHDDWYLWYNGRKAKHKQIGLAIQPGGELRF